MNSRDEYAIKMLRYLDNELGGPELRDYLSHSEVVPVAERTWRRKNNSPQLSTDLVVSGNRSA
jgi:hypothetical protein